MCELGGLTLKEDRNLVKRLQAGDEEAFNQLYQKYCRLIYHIVFSILENRDDTNDIVQDTFMIVIEKINSFNARNNFKSWIIRIAKNKTIDFLRRKQRLEYDECLDSFEAQPTVARRKSDFELILNEYRDIINKDEFNVITLHLFHDLKFSEIAKIYNKTQSSVNNIYHRGISKIKKNFEREKEYGQTTEKLF